MKKHIVRSMETDRYGFTVPTKLSELEDDVTPNRPSITGVANVTLTDPGPDGPKQFPMSGVSITERVGFELPVGNLDIVVPETGVYAITCIFAWYSTTTSGSGVGRITTPGVYQLQTVFSGTLQAAIDGTYLRDNKLGILTTDPGDLPVQIVASIVSPLSAGDQFSPTAYGISLAAQVSARVTLQIVRIA